MRHEIRSPNLRPGERPVSVLLKGRQMKFAGGGLASHAKAVAAAGRFGDDHLVHMSGAEFDQIRKAWGEPTINPETGLPQYDLIDSLASYWQAAKPYVQSALTDAAVGAGTAALTNGNVGKGALIGAGAGLVGAAGTQGNLGGLSNAASKLDLYNSMFGGSGSGSGLSGVSVPGGSSNADAAYMQPIQSTGAGADYMQPITPGGTAAPATAAAAAGGTNSGGLLHTALSAAAKNPGLTLTLLATVLGKKSASNQPPAPAQNVDTNFSTHLQPMTLDRTLRPVTYTDPRSYYTYGGEPQFYNSNSIATSPVHAARGGVMGALGTVPHQASQMQGPVSGPGDGRSDSIPAKLSDGEFVVDAESTALLGDGSVKAGAAKLEQMRANLRKHKGAALAAGKISPNAKDPMQYMKRGK